MPTISGGVFVRPLPGRGSASETLLMQVAFGTGVDDARPARAEIGPAVIPHKLEESNQSLPAA
jgi:hypothetical protein